MAFGLMDWLLVILVGLSALQLGLCYWVGSKATRESQPLVVGLLLLIGVSILTFILLTVALSAVGFAFMDCCYAGTTLNTAREEYFFYDIIVSPLWLVIVSMVVLSLIAFFLGRLKHGGVVVAVLVIAIGVAMLGA